MDRRAGGDDHAAAAPLNWAGGRPIIVTDLRDPAHPVGYPMKPIDLFRRDGVTAYSHDVQVDDMGIAWVSGDGGTRGYWTKGRHWDPLARKWRRGDAAEPDPVRGRRVRQERDRRRRRAASSTTRSGRSAGTHRAPTATASICSRPRRTSSTADLGCSDRRATSTSRRSRAATGARRGGRRPQNTFRLKTVGSWAPFEQEGSRPVGGPYAPGADFCSAHYFDVRGSTVAYAWYGEGTRFLDISNPRNPKQIAYWRPDDTLVWASYFRGRYIYTADHVRGIDVLRLTSRANLARSAKREVQAKPMSARQRAFLARLASKYRADPATRGLCLLIQ